MKVDKTKLEKALARACISWKDLPKAAGVCHTTIVNVKNGSGATPITVGKIARALGCDISDILESERQDREKEMTKDLSLEMIDASLHKLMDMDFSDFIGITRKGEYQTSYHGKGLYSVEHIVSGIICLVYAHDAYEAIEIVETYRGEV